MKTKSTMAMLVIAAALFSSCGQNGGSEKQRVIIAVGGKTGIAYLPLTLAEQKGFFKEENIEVEIQDLQGGAKALQALVGGSADLVVGYYDHTIQMQAQGRDITGIVLFARHLGFVLSVRSDLTDRVHQVSDLKGMKVGVTAPGSSSHFFINYLLSKHGMKPEDISAIGIGASGTAVAAVEQKQVDALVNLDPMITILESRGLIKALVDTRTEKGTLEVFGSECAGASLYTTREFVDRNPALAERLATALVKALGWMNGKSAEEIAASVPDSYFAGGKDIYLKGLAASMEIFTEDGRFPESAPQSALAVLSQFDEKVAGAKIDLSKTYTNRFVE